MCTAARILKIAVDYIYNLFYRIFIGKKKAMDNVEDKFKNVDWSKYSKESLKFVMDELNDNLKETIVMYRNLTEKCYFAFVFFVSVIGYCVTKLSFSCQFIPEAILLFGMCLCIWFIFGRLIPTEIQTTGANAEHLLTEDHENTSNQIEYYYKCNIMGIQEAIDNNDEINEDRAIDFETTAQSCLVTFIIYFIVKFIFLAY